MQHAVVIEDELGDLITVDIGEQGFPSSAAGARTAMFLNLGESLSWERGRAQVRTEHSDWRCPRTGEEHQIKVYCGLEQLH